MDEYSCLYFYIVEPTKYICIDIPKLKDKDKLKKIRRHQDFILKKFRLLEFRDKIQYVYDYCIKRNLLLYTSWTINNKQTLLTIAELGVKLQK
jgi:hypothetical protein